MWQKVLDESTPQETYRGSSSWEDLWCTFCLSFLESSTSRINESWLLWFGNFKCTQCDEKFRKHHQLRSHFAEVHCTPGTKPFLCEHPGCDRSFAQKVHLKAHVKTHDRTHSIHLTHPNWRLTFTDSSLCFPTSYFSLSLRLSPPWLRFAPARFSSIPSLVEPPKAHEISPSSEMSLPDLQRQDVYDSTRTQESFTNSRKRGSERGRRERFRRSETEE